MSLPKDMQGRLDEILELFEANIKLVGKQSTLKDRESAGVNAYAEAETALTHLIEAYVVAELEEILEFKSIVANNGDHPFKIEVVKASILENRLQQLNSKEIK